MKKLVTLTLCFVLMASSVAAWAAPSPTFQDVKEGDWYVDDVAYVYEHGLMNGSGNRFAVKSPVTRAMLVTILHRLEGSPAAGTSSFTDVSAGSYYASPVAWAADNGIVNGTSTTTFSPERSVTREQMAAILYRYTQYKNWDVSTDGSLNQFSDQGKVSDYARTALTWAVDKNLISGSNGALSPKGSAQRVQAAAILHRFCENVSESKPSATGNPFVAAPAVPDVLSQMPKDFVFASGVGGWSTGLTIYPDGTFEGGYHDNEMGSTGPGYPYGSVYYCDFSGSFTDVTQVSEYVYTMRLASLEVADPDGYSYIEDNIRYIASGPYGMEDGDLFYLYLPGCPTRGLPEEYLDWIRMPHAWSSVPATLPFWGLYNVGGEAGFFGE